MSVTTPARSESACAGTGRPYDRGGTHPQEAPVAQDRPLGPLEDLVGMLIGNLGTSLADSLTDLDDRDGRADHRPRNGSADRTIASVSARDAT